MRVIAVYTLSEAGRKTSLLAGGDGRARQELAVTVPATRLHLVTVDAHGVARLKLQPRFELSASQLVLRYDTPPKYDAPPTLDDLLRDAARNYELERTYFNERSSTRDRKREAWLDRRMQIARDFLADPALRAMGFPVPSPTRCYLRSPWGA